MIYIILAMLISFLAAAFAIQNAVAVWVRMFFWEFETSLVLVILGSICLGFLVAMLFTMYFKLKNFWQLRRQEREINELQEKIILLEAQINTKNTTTGEAVIKEDEV